MNRLAVLNAVEIPAPCSADWDAMPGTDQIRFCGVCCKHVHNLSALSEREAAELLGTNTELPCVRLDRRSDGGVRTASKRPSRLTRLGRLAAGVLLGVSALGCAHPGRESLSEWAQTMLDWFRPPARSTSRATPPQTPATTAPAPLMGVPAISAQPSPQRPVRLLGKPKIAPRNAQP